MRSFLLSTALFSAFLFIRCAAVHMSVVVVPESGNSVEATLYAGNNGFGFNALYATKNLILFNTALQASPIFTKSRAYDIGLGKVMKDATGRIQAMAMFTYGYGIYRAEPFVLGATGQVWQVDSDAKRLSLYLNRPFAGKCGIIGRFSTYWGHSRQKRILADPVEKHAFTAFGIEGIFYLVPGKRRHFMLGLGLGLSTGKANYKGYTTEKDFNPSPASLFFGYRLAKNSPASPLPFSQ